MNPFCLKSDFLRNRLRVICFWFLRYAFFLIVMLSGIYTPIYWLLKFSKWFKYALKGQKLLAQGIALGIKAISKAPCKGKSFIIA